MVSVCVVYSDGVGLLPHWMVSVCLVYSDGVGLLPHWMVSGISMALRLLYLCSGEGGEDQLADR